MHGGEVHDPRKDGEGARFKAGDPDLGPSGRDLETRRSAELIAKIPADWLDVGAVFRPDLDNDEHQEERRREALNLRSAINARLDAMMADRHAATGGDVVGV